MFVFALVCVKESRGCDLKRENIIEMRWNDEEPKDQVKVRIVTAAKLK